MRFLQLPQPPNPDDGAYTRDVHKYLRAHYQWSMRVKGLIEDAWRVNAAPVGTPFLATSFTTNTTITGTSTGTDVANFIASLVQAMTNKGLTSPTASRTNTI